ncbi:MAG TPA: MFS transporter [Polyangiaceae bacterium]|nr:MFS transporter [Polyangiaceae bacterium]
MDSPAPKGTLKDDLRALLESPRELWLVYAVTFLEYVGVYSFLLTLALWLTSDQGMDDKKAGWWAATFSTLITLFLFLVGSLADAIGVRKTLILSFSLAALTRFAMSLAPTPATAVTAMLAFGLAFATTSPVLQTAIQRTAKKRARAFAFSLWYVSFNLAGALIGPLLIDPTRHAFLDPHTGKLAAHVVTLPLLGARSMTANGAIMGVGAFSALLAVFVVLLFRKDFEHRRDEEDTAEPEKKPGFIAALRDVLGDKTFWRFIVLLVFLSLVKMMFQHMNFTWPKYVSREQGDSFPLGTVSSLNSFLILFLAPLGTALTRNRKPFNVLLLGAFISSLSPFVLCFGSALPYQIAMILFLTVGEALWSPRLYEYNVAIAPRGREATYVSLAALPYFLAKFLVGPSSGYLLAAFCPAEGPRHAAIMWAIIGVTTMVGPVGIWIGRGWMAKETT